MRTRVALLFAAVLLLATPAKSAIFEKVDDADFIRNADGIIIGRVLAVQPNFDGNGEIISRVSIDAGTVIKGPFNTVDPVVLTEMGGQMGDHLRIVFGAPQFTPGERVLLFLTHDIDGNSWSTQTLEMGKFTFGQRADGTDILMRGTDVDPTTLIWDGNTNMQAIEQPRLANAFVQYVRDVLAGKERGRNFDPDPDTPGRDRRAGAESVHTAAPEQTYPASAYVMNSMRWQLFDNGGTATYYITGSQPGFDSVGTAQRALAAWTNDPNSTIRLALGSGSGGQFVQDGINSIVYNASSGVPAGAIGYGQAYAVNQHTYKGETFWTIVEGDVIMKSGLSMSAQAFDEAVTHEVGHTIGLRHSNEGTPASNDAVMYATDLGTHGANLAAWDREAIAAVYGSGTPTTCTAPVIVTQPVSQTISSGQSATLTVTASGSGPLTYNWYAVTSSGSQLIQSGASASVTVAPTATTQYFVNITNACGSATSNSAIVTVGPSCSAPVITAQPQSRTITSGQSTTLSVTATGTAPLIYQWYAVTSSGSQLIQSGSSSSVTVAPTSTTQYFVNISNSCGAVGSNSAFVTVNPSCAPPAITTQPQSTTINTGQSATLSVAASGTGPLTYYWYQVTSSGSQLIQSGGSASVTVAPSATTQYFVNVYNSCGSASSNSAFVTVRPACTPPTITSQPQSVTISRGQSATLSVVASGTTPFTYYWYAVTSSGSQLIQSGSSASVTVTPSSTTQYFVAVYNSCGNASSNSAFVTVR